MTSLPSPKVDMHWVIYSSPHTTKGLHLSLLEHGLWGQLRHTVLTACKVILQLLSGIVVCTYSGSRVGMASYDNRGKSFIVTL
jgi:hypothetical protein